jgi:uncharacterized pyridoxamine 5'-phosphate oxidase family protein
MAINPRVRPVSSVRTDGMVVYVANLKAYGKTSEIAINPKVELFTLMKIITICVLPAKQKL